MAAFEADIHREYGLSCRDCHGGNAGTDDITLAKDKSFKGAPARAGIPLFCGGCHADPAAMRAYNPALRTDQLSQYETSRHGQLLKTGDTKVAVCIDCHGVHGILSARMPKSTTFPWNIPQTCGRCHADKGLMAGYRIPTDQVDEYMASVHAKALFEKKDLSAPVCNDCHGNHGAFPPAVSSVASVCRQCHAAAGELFGKSPHKKAFDDMGAGECEACHGNHKILTPSTAMIGTAAGAVCIQCHDQGSRGYEAAAEMRRTLDGFTAGYSEVEGLLSTRQAQGRRGQRRGIPPPRRSHDARLGREPDPRSRRSGDRQDRGRGRKGASGGAGRRPRGRQRGPLPPPGPGGHHGHPGPVRLRPGPQGPEHDPRPPRPGRPGAPGRSFLTARSLFDNRYPFL